jgi:hypothetical protein
MPRLRKLALALSATVPAVFGVAVGPAHAAPAAQALLKGKLGYEGGAFPNKFHPTAGVVDVEFQNPPLVLQKQVGSSGHFKMPLGPGTYTVIGCGPGANGGSNGECSKPQTVTLQAGEVDHVTLIWAHVP